MNKKDKGSHCQIKKVACDIYNVENNNLLSSKIIDYINIEKRMYKVVEEKFKIPYLEERREVCKNIKIVTYDIKYNEIGLVEKEKEELVNKEKIKFYSICPTNNLEGIDLYNIYEARINTNTSEGGQKCRLFEENKEFYINNYYFSLTLKNENKIFGGKLVNNNIDGKIFENSFFDFYGKVNLTDTLKTVIREEYKTFLKVNNIGVVGISNYGILTAQVEYLFKVRKEIYVLKNDQLSVFCPIKQEF